MSLTSAIVAAVRNFGLAYSISGINSGQRTLVSYGDWEHVTVARSADEFVARVQWIHFIVKALTAHASDLEFKVIYVGSAESESQDQELDSILVGPVPVGVNKFMFEANPPDPTKLPHDDIVGVTVILLTCLYEGKEFVRVGYYVNNEYADEKMKENPPETILFDQLTRNILADKPRVTRFNIEWDTPLPTAEAGTSDEAMDTTPDGPAAAAIGVGV
ncbi:Histone chaperone asf1 [Gonapodya sp. JEL0774]|nr:Histone chaperone asf1 [Gonapodya sp. JEL0774]